MAMAHTLEGLIVKKPELRSGRPIIAGTGVTVRTVVGHYKLGLTPEEIADEMSLELAGVYAALAACRKSQIEQAMSEHNLMFSHDNTLVISV